MFQQVDLIEPGLDPFRNSIVLHVREDLPAPPPVGSIIFGSLAPDLNYSLKSFVCEVLTADDTYLTALLSMDRTAE